MDIATGKTYETFKAALADGAKESDVVRILERRLADGAPVVKFSKGSFKSYRRTEDGELVRV